MSRNIDLIEGNQLLERNAIVTSIRRNGIDQNRGGTISITGVLNVDLDSHHRASLESGFRQDLFIDGLSIESINRGSNSVLEGRIRETITEGIDDLTSIITIGTTRLVSVLFISINCMRRKYTGLGLISISV